jgi:hypothetical protein
MRDVLETEPGVDEHELRFGLDEDAARREFSA